MAIVLVNLPEGNNQAEWIDRVNGCVCVNGSFLLKCGRYEAVVVYPDGDEKRDRLTGQEAATFIRNFLDEGFDEKVTVS